MQINWFQLDEDRILVEQLRLILRNATSALVPTILLTVLLVWALSNDSNTVALRVWGVLLVSSKLYATFHARRHLATFTPYDRTRSLVWSLIIMNVVDGMIWGAFTWVTLSTSTTAGSILIISTIAGIVGSSMARLSPVMPVFIAFVTTMLVLVAINIWLLGDPAFTALGIGCLFYLASIMMMARNSSREIRAAINLSFENIALLEQLKIKTEIAETSRREAENANTAKSKFLAAASHDLRQPIHAQGLFLEVLSRTEQTPHQKALLVSARAASEASSELLNALLDFSRIEAGVVEPQLQPFRLQPLLNKIENAGSNSDVKTWS